MNGGFFFNHTYTGLLTPRTQFIFRETSWKLHTPLEMSPPFPGQYHGIIMFVFHVIIAFMVSTAKSASLERALPLEGFLDTHPV